MKPAPILLALLAFLLPLSAPAQTRTARAEPHIQPATAVAKAAAPKRRTATASKVALPLPDAREKAQLDRGRPMVAAMPIGFPRAIPALETEARLVSRLTWQDIGGGRRAAAVEVTSHGAVAVRLGVYVSALPLDARLRFAGPTGPVHEFTGEQVLETIANNLESGATGVEARTFWSPVIESQTAVMEVDLPQGVPAEHLRIGVPRLSHIMGSAENGFAAPKRDKACHIDVSCHSGSWGVESNAVARMVFTVEGVSYACSGTLLADQDPSSAIPYFHTAQHCIPDQAAASSIVTYWFYRSRACDSSTPARYEVRAGGATLLFTDRDSDVAFLRLNAQPPAGALFAGWMAGEPIATGTPVTGIHHPTGDFQKISFGSIASYVSCLAHTADSMLCNHTFVPDAKFYSVTWHSGVTDAGSSGSGLFIDNGRYLVGQLFGGSSSCEAKSAGDYYARFDMTYRGALRQWLGEGGSQHSSPMPLRLRLSTSLSIPRSRER
jgi:hypothetical protein